MRCQTTLSMRKCHRSSEKGKGAKKGQGSLDRLADKVTRGWRIRRFGQEEKEMRWHSRWGNGQGCKQGCKFRKVQEALRLQQNWVRSVNCRPECAVREITVYNSLENTTKSRQHSTLWRKSVKPLHLSLIIPRGGVS